MDSKRQEEYPEVSEFIIGTVKSIFKQGAFIELDEYPGKRGMLHLSEISLKWVKNIRDYVKEGQKVVLLVLRTDQSRGHIDLSLRRVNDAQRKEKLQEVKQRQRAVKLVEILAKDVGESKNSVLEKLDSIFLESFDSLYEGLEAVSADPEVIKKFNVPEKWTAPLIELAQKNIKQPYVEIHGYVSLTTNAPTGVEFIKQALKKISENEGDAEITISYLSPPTYKVKVRSSTYKEAEKVLKESVEDCLKYFKKKGGLGDFARERPKPSGQ
ncbi:MAG: translation initiation factor IF-2 subunit alpha [Methanobacteriota archaeon]